MAQSLLGSSFDKFVSDQLSVRTNILATTTGSIHSGVLSRNKLQYNIAKGAFVRLSSGVNVVDKDKARFLGKEEYEDNGLAKAFILQGGELNKGGFQSYNLTSDFGIRPMPGITSVSVTQKGRWGSLKEATVNIKCYSRDQLSIIEALYLRPGFTVLLEWGHSTFYDNQFQLINSTQLIDFFNKSDIDEIYKEILAKNEEYSGNYDGFIGPVVNFSIKQDKDGTYNCTSKILSWGAVIESLKDAPREKIKESSNITSPFIRSLIGVSSTDQSNDSNRGTSKLTNEVSSSLSSNLEPILNTLYKTCNDKQYQDKKKWNIYVSDFYSKYCDNDPTGHSILKTPSQVNKDLLSSFCTIPFNVGDNNNENDIFNCYMSLGTLLGVISKNSLLYNTKGTPIVNINFNHNENFCYSPSNHISVDPSICLIRYEGKEFESLGLGKDSSTFNKSLPQFKTTETPTVGYTMNIMFNIGYLIKKLQQLRKDNKDVIILDYLNTILNDAVLSLGGVNEFNVGIDNNTIIVYDNQILDNSPKELTIVNTTGLKSSLRDFTIDSKLSNQLASTIAIGAAAGSGLDSYSAAFVQYNKGLVDRFHQGIDRLGGNINEATLEEYEKSLDSDPKAKSIKSHINDIYTGQKLISENIDINKIYYRDILNILKAKNNLDFKAIIPFTYNLTMDGLSGIKYGQMFSIEPERLSKNYLDPKTLKPLVGFLVTQVEHSIEGNTWLTTIGGQTAPLRGIKIK